MSIAGSSPGLGDGFLDSNTSPPRPCAWLGAVISLEPPPGNGPPWLLSACLVHPLSWGAAQGVHSLLLSAIDPPRLGSLLEPLLALPQELTWLLFSPAMLICSRQWARGHGRGAGSAMPTREGRTWNSWLCGGFEVPGQLSPSPSGALFSCSRVAFGARHCCRGITVLGSGLGSGSTWNYFLGDFFGHSWVCVPRVDCLCCLGLG